MSFYCGLCEKKCSCHSEGPRDEYCALSDCCNFTAFYDRELTREVDPTEIRAEEEYCAAEAKYDEMKEDL
jgi:hypothetical protein